MFLLRIPDEQPHIRRPKIKVLHRMELQPIGRDIQGIPEGFLSISVIWYGLETEGYFAEVAAKLKRAEEKASIS